MLLYRPTWMCDHEPASRLSWANGCQSRPVLHCPGWWEHVGGRDTAGAALGPNFRPHGRVSRLVTRPRHYKTGRLYTYFRYYRGREESIWHSELFHPTGNTALHEFGLLAPPCGSPPFQLHASDFLPGSQEILQQPCKRLDSLFSLPLLALFLPPILSTMILPFFSLLLVLLLFLLFFLNFVLLIQQVSSASMHPCIHY